MLLLMRESESEEVGDERKRWGEDRAGGKTEGRKFLFVTMVACNSV